MKIVAPFLVAILLSTHSPASVDAPDAVLVDVKRIWNKAPHNAFTDLVRFNDRWFCVFREGAGHVSPDGALRVLSSDDGQQWESAALVTSEDSDLRDAKITVTPDGRLMLAGAEAVETSTGRHHQSLVWFSADGTNWSPKRKVGDPDNWLWRITWHNGKAYGFGYGCGTDSRGLRLFRSSDGRTFETMIDRINVEGTYPNETSIVFLPDDTAYCLLRQDGQPKSGYLGTSRPPWMWRTARIAAAADSDVGSQIRKTDVRISAQVTPRQRRDIDCGRPGRDHETITGFGKRKPKGVSSLG